MGILDTISLENDVFRAYAFWTAVVLVKMVLMSPMTIIHRLKNKTFCSPEDSMFHGPNLQPKFNDEDTERVRRAHRNDLENCIPFMIIGFLYVLTGPSSFVAINIIRVGAIARITHTISYLAALQPWRAIAFFVCLGVTLYMSVQVLLFF